MESRLLFQQKVDEILHEIGPDILSYDESEFWMIQNPYEFMHFYAMEKQLLNTAIALPLSRGVHDGTHRKATITRDNKTYRLPYVIHCLMVCRMLANLEINLPKEEEDILLAAALCHDMIEDIPFAEGGKEMITQFHLNPRVYETVKLVSKRKDFTPEEELAHFHGIESNKLSLLVKLSDRGNNVEDLYNRSCWKVHEYVGETRDFFLPMIEYGLEHYPELVTTIEVLHDKIVTLTEVAEVLVDRYEAREQELVKELEDLQKENVQLRQELMDLFEE